MARLDLFTVASLRAVELDRGGRPALVGYAEVRRRTGVEMGQPVNTLSVMHEPLDGGSLAEYFALVPRDRPETP